MTSAVLFTILKLPFIATIEDTPQETKLIYPCFSDHLTMLRDSLIVSPCQDLFVALF